jgi:hypothetical protein
MSLRWTILATLLATLPTAHAQVNLDFGTVHGVPASSYGAASGQTGTWNQVGLGVTALVDLTGGASGISVNVVAGTATGTSGGTPTSEDERLLNDNFYSSNSASWSADLSGLADGDYLVFLYAPTNPAVPTGAMIVGGVPLVGVPGDPGSALIEGTSWVKVVVTVTGGSLGISGAGASFSGLAGLQVAPWVPFVPGLNLDFGTTFGVPPASYGAVPGQAGSWNKVDLGVTGLVDLSGVVYGANVTVVGTSGLGFSGPPANSQEQLLHDNFYGANGSGWSVGFSGLKDGEYSVFLYAPSTIGISTGAMIVGGIPVTGIPGDPASNLIEGTSWAKAHVTVTGGTLAISGTGVSVAGLSGLQIVPHKSGGPKSLNLDFGTANGVPASSYGAASGQAGSWNQVGLGVTTLVDLTGGPSAACVSIVAFSSNGGVATPPIDDDGELLFDNFHSSVGGAWSVFLSGVTNGDYLVFLYAPSNSITATGNMTVGGVPVASIAGHLGSTLIESTSWVKAQVTVTGGVLVVSGSDAGFSGLAGLQLVPLFGTGNYCTAGTSASGCRTMLAAVGTASATASSGFQLIAANVEGGKDGLFFFGTNGRQANSWGSGTSFQCVAPPVKRAGLLQGVGTPGVCDGFFSQDMNARWCPTCPNPLNNPGAGALVQAQLWYRDPFNTSNQTTSLSDAIEFAVGP